MWFPRGILKREVNEKGKEIGPIKYLLINASTNEEKVMTFTEIQNSAEDIRGFNNKGLNSYYSKKLPYFGVEQDVGDEGIEYYTLIKKNYYLNKIMYTAVGINRKHHIFDRSQLKELALKGHKIAGAKIMGETLNISKELMENPIGTIMK